MIRTGWSDGDIIGEVSARSTTSSSTGLLLVLVFAFLPACIGSPSVDSGSGRTQQSPCETTARNASVTIDCLGLSFKLPSSFREVEDPELVFLGRSFSPPAILSIDRDHPSVIEHESEGEESLTSAEIDGVEAVIVSNAFLEGLSRDLEARELLVANGHRSFSVILSAQKEHLPSLWEGFIASVRIEN